MMNFKSLKDLEYWLNKHGIDTSIWGTGDSKTAVDLWHELEQGESTLKGHPPERVVRIVQLIIQRQDNVLIEVEQELLDGRRRQRHQFPSEKIQSGETPPEAAVRCLQEELGVSATEIISLSEKGKKQHKHHSPSYPGLMTCYELIIFDVAVSSLPTNNFWHENSAAADIDPVRRHHWGWVSSEQLSNEQ